jgi:hypothetical protein
LTISTIFLNLCPQVLSQDKDRYKNKKMISYIIYGIYNLVFQIASIGILFYANTYINDWVIPDYLRWKNGELRNDLTGLAFVQAIVLMIEAAVLLSLIYYFNRWYLSRVVNASDPRLIANWTLGVYAVVTAGLIIVVTFLNVK